MNLPSHVGLQTHGDGDDVFFRNVQIRNLEEPLPEPVEPTVSVRSKPGALRIGQKGTVTVTVQADGADPTGEVILRSGGTVLGTESLAGGRATFAVGPFRSAGARTLTASYAGDDEVAAGQATYRLRVHRPVLRLKGNRADADRSRKRAAVRVTCRPAGIRCQGTVQLRDGRKVLGTGRVSVAGGRTATVRVALTPKARKVLRQQARDRVTLVVRLAGGGTTKTGVVLTR
ncbi:Ig-like domain-containing protein [Nocardioides sp. TF02-7]|nr:Ig-like domain-containing protein [Nocardioides sp. TF02-7]